MFKPFKHQMAAMELAKRTNLALFHDCGCGKTFTMLHVIRYLKSQGVGPALVVAPLSILDAAWLADCAKFTPDLSIISLWDKKPARRKQRLAEQHDIYVCNYETFKSLYDDIQAKEFGVMAVDESSKMKNPKSQITRALLSMAGITVRAKKGQRRYATNHIVPYRYVMSGTPAPNDKSEYWAQAVFVSINVFNPNYYAFRNRYFYSVPLGPTIKIWKFKPDMTDEFQRKIATIAHVVAKEDAIDLPEQIHEIRDVILSPNEIGIYNELKRDLVLRFKDETILASTALTEIMKLRQLTSGFCYGTDNTHVTGKSKLKELLALLEEIGDRQVIIWCNFRYEIKLLLKELGVNSCSALWSQTENRKNEIEAFQLGGKQYLIANPQSAAHGLTFTNCNYAVYFSQNYSYELQKQSEDRIHRIGQNDKCTYYHLIAKGTVDRMIHNTVAKKGDLSKEVLNFLRGK